MTAADWNGDYDLTNAVGGNGGNAAANAIQEECEAKNVVCTVVGVPKSIDNDILLVCSCASISIALPTLTGHSLIVCYAVIPSPAQIKQVAQ